MKTFSLVAALLLPFCVRSAEEVWSGTRTVNRVVRIENGKLTVRPGAAVLFSGDGRLELVDSVFVADGAAFSASVPLTNAFRISAVRGSSAVTNCTFAGLRRTGADTRTYLPLALSFEGSSLRFVRNAVRDCSGMALSGKVEVRENAVEDCDFGFVTRYPGASEFTGNRFANIRDAAIKFVDAFGATVASNQFRKVRRGVHIHCSALNRLLGNVFEDCENAFVIAHTSGNVFTDNCFSEVRHRFLPGGGPLPGNVFGEGQRLPEPPRKVEPISAFVAKARALYPTPAYADFKKTLIGTALFDYRPHEALDVPPGLVAATPTSNDVRWCRVPYLRNMRDLGGWNGLRTGRVYRGSYLWKTPEGGVCEQTRKALAELGIRTDLDLRWKVEHAWHQEAMTNMAAVGLRVFERPITAYLRAFTDLRNDFREALLVFADPANYPIYFHCKAGADRTGTMAFVLAGLCGASETDLQIDYELTSVGFAQRTRRGDGLAAGDADCIRRMLETVKSYPGVTLRERFANCAKALWGLDDAQIAVIRSQLENPEEVKSKSETFQSAEPVWPSGEETRMNAFFRFAADVELDAPAVLRVTAGYDYRAKVNGQFLGFGPARAAKGFFRVDEWPVAARGKVTVEIESAGYNCRSYYLMKQTPFLQAEVVSGGKVLAATGKDGAFRAFRTGKVAKTTRYTGQRTFLEAYRVGGEVPSEPLPLAVQPPKKLLERGWPYPDFAVNRSFRPFRRETLQVGSVPPDGEDMEFLANADRSRDAYDPSELETDPYHDFVRLAVSTAGKRKECSPSLNLEHETLNSQPTTFNLKPLTSLLFEGDRNEAGFIGLRVRAKEPVRILIGYDEVLTNGVLDVSRLACANVLEWRIEKPGEYELETFEPYNMKFARVVAVDGEAEVSAPWVRTYKSPLLGRISFNASDPALVKIFDAAKESLAGNAVDCLTDCPGRERAGWIGDTFFTGRTAALFTGSDAPERLFLDNYLRPERFEWSPKLPAQVKMDGMVPALYPGDTWTVNTCIPTYAMWFVLEIEEHCRRSGDAAFRERCRNRVLGIIAHLGQFENADGLLENLAGWVFIDWSEANRHVRGVNYPANMLYAKALDAVARLYARTDLSEKAEKIRAAVRRQSWDGTWFHDNALRQSDGALKRTDVRTEACQYFAFYTGTADRENHEALWNRLVDAFGPDRVAAGRYPEVFPCNFLYGACLRLELLSGAHRSRQVLDETKGYFLPMAERTGTLWENLSTVASCYHGFSSYVGYYLYRDVLGVREVDRVNRRLVVEPPDDLPLEFCEGTFPVSETETARIAWRRKGGRQVLETSLPDGWRLVAPALKGKP